MIVLALFLAAAGCLGTTNNSPTGTMVVTTPATGPVPHPQRYMSLHASSLYIMQKNAPSGISFSLPTYLPTGFFFTDGSLPQGPAENPYGNGVFEFSYSRGQDEKVILVEQFYNSTACPDKPVFKPAMAGSLRAARGETGELTWGDNTWCYMLTGTPPQEDLERIGASVRPAPYHEGITPPYEYVPPANPITANIPANVSLTTGTETVTVRSIRCMPDACTIEISLSPNTPQRITPSPVVTLPPPNPELHAVWQVDGGRPLLTKPGGGYSYNATSVFWKIEPLPMGSRTLTAHFTSIGGISGSWQISVPLPNSTGSRPEAPLAQEKHL